jgi:REP element-mobilizing transposase RayT
MHLVLRSTKARGDWSFFKPKNKQRIRTIITKHALRNRISLESIANVGNHLHLHIQLVRNHNYKAFIRAITGAIALAVMGLQHLKSRKQNNVIEQEHLKSRAKISGNNHSPRFWDYRPFTIFVNSYRHFLNMRDYMKINQLEGIGFSRLSARFLLAYEDDRRTILHPYG